MGHLLLVGTREVAVFSCGSCGGELNEGLGLNGVGSEFKLLCCPKCELLWTIDLDGNRLVQMDPFKPLANQKENRPPPYFIPPRCDYSDN